MEQFTNYWQQVIIYYPSNSIYVVSDALPSFTQQREYFNLGFQQGWYIAAFLTSVWAVVAAFTKKGFSFK